MKVIRTIGVRLGAVFALLMLATACDNPVFRTDGEGGTTPDGNVVIKIAGANGRTILPKAPVFDRYELTLQKVVEEGEEPEEYTPDTSGITGEGVGVQLSAGNWTITLKAYQTVAKIGNVLAATGSATIKVESGDRAQTVLIELYPLAIGEYAHLGVFGYKVILPGSYDTATLSLKNSGGGAVAGYDELDLTIEDNRSGSIALDAGYYDLSVIVTKNGQSAGTFESVHIYSGLESVAELDLSAVEFAGKVYVMGTLGGIRLGTVTIASDPAGTSAIKTLDLDPAPAVRSANWFVDIPSTYVGQTIYAVQEFEGARSEAAEIASLPANGVWDIALSATPVTPDRFNVSQWYAELTASGGEDTLAQVADGTTDTWWQSEQDGEGVWLELDFGFNVSVNAARLAFYANDGDNSVLINEYNVQYLNGDTWTTIASREHYLEGSADGSVSYGDFFAQTVTAQKFRWEVPAGSVENAPSIIEFGLYKAAARVDLIEAVSLAQTHHDDTLEAEDGTEISKKLWWASSTAKADYQNAIDAAQEARDDLFITRDNIVDALLALQAATATFDSVRQKGTLETILVSGFEVHDGYASQFVVKWLRDPAFKYVLRISSTGSGAWTDYHTFPETANPGDAQTDTYAVTGIGAGQTRYFAMQAYEDQEEGPIVYSGAKVTMGVPSLTLASSPGSSYRAIDLSWTQAQKADAYRIVYSIAGDTSPHSVEVDGNVLAYTLIPNGYNNPQITGRKIDIHVTALNKALYQASGCHEDDVTTTSNTVETRLVGPATLNANATQAAAANSIALSWDAVEGAAGYYVYRRQFNPNNTAETAAAIAYYVDASGPAVTGKDIGGDAAKASAAFAGNRFTLTDSWMTDSEYSGAYNAYTANYKNQQNDIARGNPYRYFIVPVIAETDTVTFNASGATVAYNIGDIAYNSAAALEKTGFTYGFGQNVSATKGSYASSGNVNDGVQITWSAPPLLASAGVTPTYTLYRRASGGGWETVTTLSGTTHTSTAETRGTVYEYAVGINGSQPHTLGRFITDSRTPLNSKGIPNVYGYMLEMVKLQGVSRESISVNGSFGENITLIKNADQNYIKGIDGYTVYVMNRNINANWHTIREGVVASEVDTIIQVATGMGSVTINTTAGNMAFDMLRVMRDYKHYFKVRSYVLNNGVKVYCPDDPSYTWSNGGQNDYIKWGARQITANEFITISLLYMAKGMDRVNVDKASTYWIYTMSSTRSENANGTGASGSVTARTGSSPASIEWTITYNSFKNALSIRAGTEATFITVGGQVWAQGGSSYAPTKYGDYGWVSITGPADTPLLYTGSLKIGGSGYTDMEWSNNGTIRYIYPAGMSEQTTTRRGQDTPLEFRSQSKTRYNLEEYK